MSTSSLTKQIVEVELEEKPYFKGGSLTEDELIEYRMLVRKCNNPRVDYAWSKRNERKLSNYQSIANHDETCFAWRLKS